MPKVVKKPQAVSNLESTIVRRVSARGAVSRVELARELGLVPSTAGIYVDRLIKKGFLIESAKAARNVGRPPVLVELNPKGGRFIGVDFDARHVMGVAVDFTQRPLAQLRRTLPARASVDRVLGTIEQLIADLIGPSDRDVLGIGLGVPGPIDALAGVSRRYPFIRGWVDVPVRERIAAAFRAPVDVENNIRAMALGELWCSEGRGLRRLVCLGIRSGIGSGIVIDGKLLTGASNMAGEVGRWPCPAWKATGERVQTIEDVASLTGILAEAADQLRQGRASVLGAEGESPTAERLISAAREKDPLACELVERAAQIHGALAFQLATLFDPERVIVAGPLGECDFYLRALRRQAAELGGEEIAATIVCSTLGAFGGALGAAALAFHYWKPRR